MFKEKELEKGLDEIDIPEYMHLAIRAYVNRHKLPGHFLQAVLKNDLFEAVSRADTENLEALHNWIILIYNYTPGNCWGSPEKVKKWTEIDD
jgi:hypothetical protein